MSINGKVFKYLRTNSKLTTRQFAKRCGFSKAYVTAIENEYRPITQSVMRRFLDVFGLVAEDFKEVS